MIDLGTTSFYLDAPVMSRKDFEAYSTGLFEDWDGKLAKELQLADYSLTLEIEEGSIDGLATVEVAAKHLFLGIITSVGLSPGWRSSASKCEPPATIWPRDPRHPSSN